MKIKQKEMKMPNEALELLKSLETYGYHEKEITFGGLKIILAPLTAGETIQVFEASNKYEDADAASSSLKIETLSRSIVAVNGKRFDAKKFIDEKREIILAFGSEMIDVLFNEYCQLDMTIADSIENKGSIITSAFETTQEKAEIKQEEKVKNGTDKK